MPLIAAHEIDIDQGSTPIYNGLDCCVTFEIFDKINSLINGNELNSYHARNIYAFERALQAPVMEMSLRGFRVDPAARELGIDRCRRDLARLNQIIQVIHQAVIGNALAAPINPNSGPQLREFFYNRLGIPAVKKWTKGELKYPMDRDTLEKIEIHFEARPFVAAVLAYRDLEKQLQVLETKVDHDWRIRTSYNIAGTDTSRFSSSKSILGSGTNLQNVTEDLRHVLIADPGYKIMGFDLEQTESRDVGAICGILFDDWAYLDACESGDLHTAVARMVWPKLPWTGNIKADRKIADQPFYRHHTRRQSTKRLGHASNYIGKPRTIALQTKIPEKLVAEFQPLYFDAFPAIPHWHNWVASELQRTQRLYNIYGHARDFFDRPNSDETIRSAVAYQPQSATANRTNLILWRIWKHIPEVQLLAQLHDAVYWQFPEHFDEYELAERIRPLTKVVTNIRGREFFVPVEFKSGWNWGPRWKEDEGGNKIEANPKGLDKIGAERT